MKKDRIRAQSLSEDIYLFNSCGEVISCRVSGKRRISNVFALISAEDRGFIIEHSKSSEFIPFILADSDEGPIFVMRSFYPEFKLFVAIVPHFPEDEIYALTKVCLPVGATPAPSCEERLLGFDPSRVRLSECHEEFGKRISDAFSDVRLYRAQNMTNRQIVESVTERVEALSRFIDVKAEIFCDERSIDVEGELKFSMETFLLVILCLALLFNGRKTDHGVRVCFFGHKLGLYFETLFDHEGIGDLKTCPELRAIERYTRGQYFEHVKYYREDGFFIQCCAWEEDPSEVGLKADLNFDYEDGEEERRCPSLLGRR